MRYNTWLFILMVVTLPAKAGWWSAHSSAQTVAYGTDPQQQMDVYLPKRLANARYRPVPMLVMVHGGGWRHGDKDHRAVIAHKVAYWGQQQGYVVVSINYRLLPTPVTTQLEDVAQAVRSIQQHALSWGADASNLILMGHSAGAHLVSLLATQPTWLGMLQPQPWRMTIVLDSAGYDINALMQQQHYRLYDQAFGDNPQYWQQLSPIAQLHQPMASMLLVCSMRRLDQPCDQARQFAGQAKRLGSDVQVYPVDLSHRQINLSLGQINAYTTNVAQFIEQHLQP